MNLLVRAEDEGIERNSAKIKLLKSVFEEPGLEIPWQLRRRHDDFDYGYALTVHKAQELIALKRTRTYTDKAADLQEADASYLARVREVYLELAKQTDWHQILCLDQQKLRSVDDIGQAVWEVVRSARGGD